MLAEFRVSNFRSIGEELVLSLVPDKKEKVADEALLTPEGHSAVSLLNAAALFGANGSGKSNVVKAMAVMDRIVMTSFKNASTEALHYEPFLLKEGWEAKPTSFEVVFFTQKIRYRYGFTYTEAEILEEWLFRKRESREVCMFQREGQQFQLHSPMEKAKAVKGYTKPNTLFLSACDANNIDVAKDIMLWFKNFNILLDSGGLKLSETHTLNLLKDDHYAKLINSFLRESDLGFERIELEESSSASDLNAEDTNVSQTKGKGKVSVSTVHKKQGASEPTQGFVKLDLGVHESAGTKKLFGLSGPILYALSLGGVIVVDEMEANMHPVLTRSLIQIFLNRESNPHQAQIIFTTHDTNLLALNEFRKDQVYFCEKNEWESTEMYSLSDFEGSDKDFFDKEKSYLSGKFGAIPRLSPSLLFMISDGKKK